MMLLLRKNRSAVMPSSRVSQNEKMMKTAGKIILSVHKMRLHILQQQITMCLFLSSVNDQLAQFIQSDNVA